MHMGVRMVAIRRAACVVLAAMFLATSGPASVRAQDSENVMALNMKVGSLYAQGKYAEATPFAQRALALNEQVLGKDHPDTIGSLNILAFLYRQQGRYAEAEPLYRQAFEIRERVLGWNNADTLASANNLAVLYDAQGRYAEAEPILRRVLSISEQIKGKDHPDTLRVVNNLGMLLKYLGRYAESEPLLLRTIEKQEQTLGKEHKDTLITVNNLAVLYRAQGRNHDAEPLLQRACEASGRLLGAEAPLTVSCANNLAELYTFFGRYTEAEPIFRRMLEINERLRGKDHPDTLASVNNLGALCRAQGRFIEAETLFRRALADKERMLGKEHPDTLITVINLADLFDRQGRHVEAEALQRRVLETRERVLGRNHPDTLASVNNVAALKDRLGRRAEAEPLYLRALQKGEEVLGKDHPNTLLGAANLGMMYQVERRYAEAEAHLLRAIEGMERVLGKDQFRTLIAVGNLATLYQKQGRNAEAETLFRRSLEGRERTFGKEHPLTYFSLSDLATQYFVQRDWIRAAELWRRSTEAFTKRTQFAALDTSLTGKNKSESEQEKEQFSSLVRAIYRLTPEGQLPDEAASRETFKTAQWALSSEAAHSLSEMAARSAKGDTPLAKLVRERQDLVYEWQGLDTWRNAALALKATARDAKAETAVSTRMTAIEDRMAEIDKRMAVEFKDYAALASPTSLSVEEVQAQLGGDEALVLFLDTEVFEPVSEETFVWVVTKNAVHWVRVDLGTEALAREVQALRCGLDFNAALESRCAQLTGKPYTETDARRGKPLPFDHARAHKLYQALFGQVADTIKGKHLLIVPSGPLTQLPFQVLVTVPPTNSNNKSAVWLARGHAVTVLPAVSSLQALRRVARPSTSKKPMIGFGNPLLDGDQSEGTPYRDYFKKRAQLARNRQQCRPTPLRQLMNFLRWNRGTKPVETHGGVVNTSHIRMQPPLPETADELCAVARDLHADVRELRLGQSASEHEIKRLSASGQLADYRVLHFATHGALAGELTGANEPGLILTPPQTASDEDDGYLSASEIAGLKLDADWVILSACNTAAGNSNGAQALSGLARAFIYAQARALLVSHWAVDSEATVKLITGAMGEIARNPKVGRAEALRRSMLALIDKGAAREAHPAFWAPFIVVGEGTR